MTLKYIFFDRTNNGQKHILVYRMLIAKLNNPNDKEKPLNKYMKTCTYVKHDRNGIAHRMRSSIASFLSPHRNFKWWILLSENFYMCGCMCYVCYDS